MTTIGIQLPLGTVAQQRQRGEAPLLRGDGLSAEEGQRVRALCRSAAEQLRSSGEAVVPEQLWRELAGHDNSRVAAALRAALEDGAAGDLGRALPAYEAEALFAGAAGEPA